MNNLLTAGGYYNRYAAYSSCQYLDVSWNTDDFDQPTGSDYSGAIAQVDCAATDSNNGNTTGYFTSNCYAAIEGGTTAGKGYYDTKVATVTYKCTYGSRTVYRTIDGEGLGYQIVGAQNDGNSWDDCCAQNTQCSAQCIVSAFQGKNTCCAGEDDEIGESGDDIW